jgi:hypothetical protein
VREAKGLGGGIVVPGRLGQIDGARREVLDQIAGDRLGRADQPQHEKAHGAGAAGRPLRQVGQRQEQRREAVQLPAVFRDGGVVAHAGLRWSSRQCAAAPRGCGWIAGRADGGDRGMVNGNRGLGGDHVFVIGGGGGNISTSGDPRLPAASHGLNHPHPPPSPPPWLRAFVRSKSQTLGFSSAARTAPHPRKGERSRALRGSASLRTSGRDGEAGGGNSLSGKI